ncbi:hypothetical protein IW262DRAFT_1401525 [Armillaria fumosa]|nr:hypothetical protein IW262DRAFT_1401525 [Armillaria fumosa]
MHLSSPSLAYIMTLFLTCLFHAVSGQETPPTTPGNNSQSHMICQPFGVCEPCPSAALSQPFCQPFGNRRLLHCTEASTSLEATPPNTGTTPEGEHLVWEPCGRIVGKERADFYEFVACNLLFAIVSLFILFARSRRLQLIHARQLAARIGLSRGRR